MVVPKGADKNRRSVNDDIGIIDSHVLLGVNAVSVDTLGCKKSLRFIANDLTYKKGRIYRSS